MPLIDSLKSAVSHERDKRKFFAALGNPSSSVEARTEAYSGLMKIADHQDWAWLMTQFENNLGELNSRVMEVFFVGAAQHYRQRLTDFVVAEDGIVLTSVKVINSFDNFNGAAIFLTHRALLALEVLGMTEEIRAFALFVAEVCGNKANNGLIPRKLFEERLKQYLPADIVDDQENLFRRLIEKRQFANGGNGRERNGSEERPHTSIPAEKYATHHSATTKDEPIDVEGRRAAARVAGTPEERANHSLAGVGLSEAVEVTAVQ